MNIIITEPLTVTFSYVMGSSTLALIPGSLVSGAVFNKLSHLVEYTLNKTFGDYENLRRTFDGKIIVSMPFNKDYYYTQNIALAALVATVFYKVIPFLVLAGCPIIMGVSLSVISVATPILFAAVNMNIRNTGGHHGRWVEVSEEKIAKHGIKKDTINKIQWGVHVYCGFGSAPIYFPGELTASNQHDPDY